eukprot:CAMPEP_0115390686 /NCGR_PEP_ID=MMETSP0271-20121206/10328_1 /TAXON_ID=71861 /ORGANISM="Scrippsiella trochoidea, Strain CCMP3099" /LENGTH=256 /DNA_ID=CAMNT_0002814233 /DNA_START=19 /DNA_END=789 /DNA_ORIENTATION=+
MAAHGRDIESIGREGLPVASCEDPPAAPERSLSQQIRSAVGESARSSKLPAALTLVCDVLLIALYYGGGDSTAAMFEWAAELKEEQGILFSVVSTGIFGGVLPTLLMITMDRLKRPRWAHALFNVVFWLALGATVDWFYRFQVMVNGDHVDVVTVIKKVCLDQFVWNPVFNLPVIIFLHRWRDHDFRISGCSEFMRPRGFLVQYVSSMLICWCTWIPGTCTIYVFPTLLQMPIFNFILLTYATLINMVSQHSSSDQ